MCMNRLAFIALVVIGSGTSTVAVETVQIEMSNGVTQLLVDGKPVRARMFWGAPGSRPLSIGSEAKKISFEFSPTEDEPSACPDSSMIFHVKDVRSLLDSGSIHPIAWIDKRDMLADGLTKGKPSGDDINHALQQATWIRQRPHKTLPSSTKPGSQASSPATHQYQHT